MTVTCRHRLAYCLVFVRRRGCGSARRRRFASRAHSHRGSQRTVAQALRFAAMRYSLSARSGRQRTDRAEDPHDRTAWQAGALGHHRRAHPIRREPRNTRQVQPQGPDAHRRADQEQGGRCLKEARRATALVEVVQVNSSNLTLTRQDLDSTLSKRPMLLEDTSGHTDMGQHGRARGRRHRRQHEDPAGGRIERDAAGNPTGTLHDVAAEIVSAAEPSPGLDFEVAQLAKALEAMRATGITWVQDADTDEHDMSLYKRARRSASAEHARARDFRPEVYGPAGRKIDSRGDRVGAALVDRPDFLRADAVKIFADGVIEYLAQTAALLEPYLDAQGRPTQNRGPTYYSQAHLNDVVSAANAAASRCITLSAIGRFALRSMRSRIAAPQRRA